MVGWQSAERKLFYIFPIYLFDFTLFFPGDLLLKLENLDKKLIAAILMSEEDTNTQGNEKHEEPPPAQLRPFHWYNYLQKERPTEFGALNELKQKLQTGILQAKFVGI